MRKSVLAGLCACLSTLVLQAATMPVSVTLGQSAENFVEYGTGGDGLGNSTWNLQQGACGLSGGTTTCTLSGTFTGSTTGFTSGTYSFITSYSGSAITSIRGVGETADEDYFNYSYLSPSTSMVLNLTPSGGTMDTITLVSGGAFVDSSFNFTDTGTYSCSGVAVPFCTEAEVGLVDGAVGQSPVITNVTFDVDVSSPPTGPSSTAPEPRFLACLGLALLIVPALRLTRKNAAERSVDHAR